MMEQENTFLPVTDQLSSAVLSIGSQLRAGRVRLGLSVEDVVSKIKLAPRQIIALEADDFAALPETAFVRGFVRSYARLLQMDEQPLLDALPGAKVVQVKVEPLQIDAPFPTEGSARRQTVNLLIAALLVALAAGGFYVWKSRAPHVIAVNESTPLATPLALPEQADFLNASGVPESVATESAVVAPAAAPAQAPAAAPVQAPAAAPKASLPAAVTPLAAAPATAAHAALRLVFDKESWVEVKDKFGKTLSKQNNQAGSELRLEGDAPFSLVIGHAAAVHLYYRERLVNLTSYINASSDVARMTLE